jgi:hypothetical protein
MMVLVLKTLNKENDMRKILLIIALTLCMFQMVVLATNIDIGVAATDRATAFDPYTVVNKGNPANATGTITSVEIWANTNLSNCEIATFFNVSGANFSTRDTHTIGSVTAGSKQTFSGLSIDVQTGDLLGIYYTAGKTECDSSGGSGVWYAGVDYIPCTDVTFASLGGYVLSVYGTGTTEAAAEDNAIFFGINQ